VSPLAARRRARPARHPASRRSRAGATVRARAAAVELVVFDVDGVLTDGGLWYGPEGEALKRFHVKDGHGMVMARLTDLKVALLTARTSAMVEVRARELRLPKVLQGQKHKAPALKALCEELGVSLDACAYMGDDTNDLAPMALVGLAACPADAVPEARAAAHFVATKGGGQGAARELLELVLKATGRWERALAQMMVG
jgi:3-deoxy-D-manno-octulosonate 8-phosphate phosphatase (KDO 8-P phosphatase)